MNKACVKTYYYINIFRLCNTLITIVIVTITITRSIYIIYYDIYLVYYY